MRRLALLPLLAAALAVGCGSAPAGCSARVRAAVARLGASASASEHAEANEPGIASCVYRTRTSAVRVSVDTLPQAYRRWADAEEERVQNTVGWQNLPGEQPQPVDRVGAGAYWIPSLRELDATDGTRLVIARVARASSPRQLAVSVARLSVGRPK